jgi:PIN domain nuclease of toxin-antitoxin system
MRLLLDTHVLIWALADPDRLSDATRKLLQRHDDAVLFSAASIWEIAIKAQLRRVSFSVRPEQIVQSAIDSGFEELPVFAAAAARVETLPSHHRDPFDRLLLAQAMHEPARFLTVDPLLPQYSDLVILLEH